MRFWQLFSIARDQPELLRGVALQRFEWARYAANAAEIHSIIDRQDRQILDEVVDADFSRAVLTQVKKPLYLGGGCLRSRRLQYEIEISVLEAVLRFGGEAVEDAFEKGSTPI